LKDVFNYSSRAALLCSDVIVVSTLWRLIPSMFTVKQIQKVIPQHNIHCEIYAFLSHVAHSYTLLAF